MREWLKTLREQKGLTMKELSEKLSISESYYCAVENGNRQKKMDLFFICEIARALEVSVETVVQLEREYLCAIAS